MTTTLTEPTMRAVLQHRYGTAEALQLGRVPCPVIGDHDVLIEVHAAGLDRGTEHLLTGKPYAMRLAIGMTRPRNPVPGRDVAGTVADIGAAVTRFAVGDEVYGVAPGRSPSTRPAESRSWPPSQPTSRSPKPPSSPCRPPPRCGHSSTSGASRPVSPSW
jgi:hypothetical protein